VLSRSARSKLLGNDHLEHMQKEHQALKDNLQAVNDMDADKDLPAFDAKVRLGRAGLVRGFVCCAMCRAGCCFGL
jgi:hypothetical protein